MVRRRPVSARPVVATALASVACLVLVACTSPTPRIEVTEVDGPFTPLEVVLTGLEPGSVATLESRATVGGSTFLARATFDVADDGTVDLGEDAPIEGDWDVADPMAPIWSMTAGGRHDQTAWDASYDIDLEMLDASGDVVAARTVERAGHAPDVDVREVANPEIFGEYVVPAGMSPAEQRPAVLVFGGSEGGDQVGTSTARRLAGLGYPALGIAYFAGPGQPTTLAEVPVETFLDALAWLHDQPEVDTEAVATFGVSRGGEMALWLAAERPELVAAAIAPTGAGAVVCGYPDATRPAWTLAGEPLTDECYGAGDREPPTSSLIDVAAIDGPVVLACGMRDELWSACGHAEDVVQRRGHSETVLVRHEDAGHAVASAPYVPVALGSDTFAQFGVRSSADPAATHQVRVELWREVAALLESLRESP